jgi:hypothetical protein
MDRKEQSTPKTTCTFLNEKENQIALIRKKMAKFGFNPIELNIPLH